LRIKKQKQNAMGYIQVSGRVAKREHSLRYWTDISSKSTTLTMVDSLQIATLNINGLTNATRITMLESFIRVNDIDILVVQEWIYNITLYIITKV
jgi:hypothetical protein